MTSWKTAKALIFLIVTISLVARLFGLETSPPGLYVDEACSVTNAACISEDLRDTTGRFLPLYSPGSAYGGFTNPVYNYVGAAWAKTFGISIYSFRMMSTFFMILTIIGVFYLGLYLAGEGLAWFALLSASLSPWAFQFGRIAWDPSLMPCFLIWGILLFLYCRKHWQAALGGIVIAMAMYSYSASRATFLMLLPILLFIKWRKQKIMWRYCATYIFVWLLASIPLLIVARLPEFQSRIRHIGIITDSYLSQFGEPGIFLLLKIYFLNVLKHLTPDFLFVHGDIINVRHSPQISGELSWLDILAFLALPLLLIKKQLKEIPLILFFLFGIVAGITPAALTWDSLPHALRSLAAFPFFSLLAGYLLWKLYLLFPKTIYPVVIVALTFFIYFNYRYYKEYPVTGHPWFDSDIKEAAVRSQETGDWRIFAYDLKSRGYFVDHCVRYFLMRYKGVPCQEGQRELDILLNRPTKLP